MIQDGKFLQVSTIIFGSISKIYCNLDAIQSKIDFISNAINKLKAEKQKNKNNNSWFYIFISVNPSYYFR